MNKYVVCMYEGGRKGEFDYYCYVPKQKCLGDL